MSDARSRRRAAAVARTALVAAAVASAPGCLVPMIPYPVTPHVEPARLDGLASTVTQDLSAFVPGRTTRTDVLLRLGEPDAVLDGERTFVYVGEQKSYAVLGVPNRPDGGGRAEFGSAVALTFRFDAAGCLVSAEPGRAGAFGDVCDLVRGREEP